MDETPVITSPLITVCRGSATPAEIAAVVAVLLAAGSASRSAPAVVEPAAAQSAWTDRARAWHALPRPGPHAWRAAALPR
jgi:hypothetical protein